MLWTEFPNPIFGNKTKKKKEGRKQTKQHQRNGNDASSILESADSVNKIQVRHGAYLRVKKITHHNSPKLVK